MMKNLIRIVALLAIAWVGQAPAAPLSGGYPSVQVQSFCASGCNSTATTFTLPFGAHDLRATYCGGGGSGAGGYNAATGGGGGGGSGVSCAKDYAIAAPPGTVFSLTIGSAGAAVAAGAQGLNGTKTFFTWTVGALSYSAPPSFGGGGGIVGTAPNSGSGGSCRNAVDGGAGNTAVLSWVAGACAGNSGGVSGSATNANTVTAFGALFWGGSGGAAGGGATAGNGGGTMLLLPNGSNAGILGGTGSGTCGAGGAGGSSIFGLGGAGGNAGGSAGSAGGGFGAGGGGGACQLGGGAGTAGMVSFSWVIG